MVIENLWILDLGAQMAAKRLHGHLAGACRQAMEVRGKLEHGAFLQIPVEAGVIHGAVAADDLAWVAFSWVPLHARQRVLDEGFTAFGERADIPCPISAGTFPRVMR